MKIVIDGREVTIPVGSGGGVPKGSIIIWSGTASDIPDGWALCDGQDGRPDLRDRFVLGGGGTQTAGETGGEEKHMLTVEEMPEHGHGIRILSSENDYYSTAGPIEGSLAGTTQATEPAGGSQPHNNMPPYYVLYYIIKVTDCGSGGGGSLGIQEYDTEDGWHVRKWSDGYVEMIYKGTNPSKGSYEAPYTYYTIHNQISLPIVLVERYSENLSLLDSSNTYNPKVPMVYTAGDNEKTSSWGVFIMVKATGVAMNYSLVVTGRWK